MRVDERSDARAVSRRILTLPRLTAVAAIVLLVSATISLAADKPAAMKKPANHSQSPKPGTHVLDTGAPTITLHLARGKSPELGQPQDRSPYGASLIRRPAKHA